MDISTADPAHAQAQQSFHQSSTTRLTFRQDAPDRSWLLKEHLGPAASQRLTHERAVLQRLEGCPGVVSTGGPGPQDDGLLLESIEGPTLAQALQAGALPLHAILSVAAGVARTLACLHRAGVVHGDICPSNILLPQGAGPVLVDFDCALLDGCCDAAVANHRLAGTLAYLAPEQTGRTQRTVDGRSDLYALGAVLYEAVSGRPPFDSRDPLQLMHDHLVLEPVSPAQRDASLPQPLSELILRLLAKEPQQRYQSADGLAYDLQALSAQLRDGLPGVPLALGSHDFAERFAAPDHAVGRERESAALRHAFERALDGGRAGVLIGGPAGVGKSTLVSGLRATVAACGGWFVAGKFDSQRQDLASDAVYQCLRSLGRLLLAQPEEDLNALRERIAKALGASGCALVAQVPEFATLLSQQPALVDDPLTAKDQLVDMTLSLLRAVATPQRPVVMVTEDLHWAPPLPLALINAVLTDGTIRGLFLIGTYRDEHLEPSSPFAALLPRWQRLAPAPLLQLRNLELPALTSLVSEILRLPRAQARQLAPEVMAQTAGNPFDTVHLLDGLRREGALVLRDEGWTWDAAAIRRHIGQGRVLGLLAARIQSLPQQTRELLDVMACLGGEVEPELLQAATGWSAAALAQPLAHAVEEGLLSADTGRICFRHDRVQQACGERLAPQQRQQLHLAVARLLAVLPQFEATAAHQFVPALELLQNPQEQRTVALLLRTAARTLQAFRPAAADGFLRGAIGLLRGCGATVQELLPLKVERHVVLYGLGQLEEGNRLYGIIERHSTEPLQLVDPACVQICSLTNQGRPREAVALGEALLARLGLALPAGPELGAQLGQGSVVFARWLDPGTVAGDLARPDAADPHVLAAGRLLNRMTPPSFFCDPQILAAMVLLGQRLWVEHGPAAQFVGLLSHASFVSVGAWRDYHTARAVAYSVLRISEARRWEPETSQARFLVALGTSSWWEPLQQVLAEARRAHAGLLEGGDPQNACFTFYATLYPLLDCAPLDRYAAEAEAALALATRTGNDHAGAAYLPHRQLARALRGQTGARGSFNDESFREEAHLAALGSDFVGGVNFHLLRALGAAVFGDLPTLLRHAQEAFTLQAGVPAIYNTVPIHLVQGLALAQQALASQGTQRDACLEGIAAIRAWLAARAQDMPSNFAHTVHWLDAERAWVLDDFAGALRSFDAARGMLQVRERPWQRALLAERQGLFLLAHGVRHAGEDLVRQACEHYAQWGATEKVRALRNQHGFLARHAEPAQPVQPADAPSRNTDMLGLLRASQALSSETDLDSLKARVVQLLVTMTGATSVQLALRDAGHSQWILCAASDRPVTSTPVEQAGQTLPLSAFHYAERTLQPLQVEDATRDDRFARDPCLAGLDCCSLLLVPILSQGAARAMLVLENRRSRGAFATDGLDAVMLIASQLAVSLENALLYRELEQRVRERTAQLQETQAELVATARKAGMAEIATNVLHNVGNILNSVNVSASVVASTIAASKGQRLDRVVGLLDEHTDDLGRFVSDDPQGRLLPRYLRELANAMAAERQELSEELRRLTGSVDHIKSVVATQQAYAGLSSVFEPVDIGALVRDALRINDDSLAWRRVTVVSDVCELPLLRLDKTRVMQILVNLIANAKQAMEGSAAGQQLTLRAAAVGDRLRIRVEDDGVGISAQDLTRIFSHGFTTRSAGHGFGLHSCALAAREMGGALLAESEGPGKGAAFTLDLPLNAA